MRSQIDVNENQVRFGPERPETSALKALPPFQELPKHFLLVLHAWHTISVDFKLELAERKWLVVFLGVLDQRAKSRKLVAFNVDLEDVNELVA